MVFARGRLEYPQNLLLDRSSIAFGPFSYGREQGFRDVTDVKCAHLRMLALALALGKPGSGTALAYTPIACRHQASKGPENTPRPNINTALPASNVRNCGSEITPDWALSSAPSKYMTLMTRR